MTEKSGNETLSMQCSTCIKDAQSVTLKEQIVEDHRLSASGLHYSANFSTNRVQTQTTNMNSILNQKNESSTLDITTDPTTALGETSVSGKPAKEKAKKPVPEHDRHEFAEVFPQLREKSREELRTDIEQQGLLEPIMLYDGKILDGWNRALVCAELGIQPEYTQYTGDDPLRYVVSKNLKRRHLTAGQRAMIADTLANMPRGGDRKSEQIKPPKEGLISREAAAKQLNVSETSVERAHKVRTDAIPEVVEAVTAGEMSVTAAVAISDATPEEQREIIALGDTKAISAAAKNVKPKKQRAKPKMCAQKIVKEILDVVEVVSKIPALFGKIRENNLPHDEAELETLRVMVANELEVIVVKVRSGNAEQATPESVTTLRLAEKTTKNAEPSTEIQQTVA